MSTPEERAKKAAYMREWFKNLPPEHEAHRASTLQSLVPAAIW